MLSVSEIFTSIQGEGIRAGMPTTFIRFQGCSVSCSYCDTLYGRSFAGGREMSPEDILEHLKELPIHPRWVCLTGGEPLEQPSEDLHRLVDLIHAWDADMVNGVLSHAVEIETSGCFKLPYWWWYVASWNWDIKCPSAEAKLPNLLNELEKLRNQDQVKFVIGDESDLRYAMEVIAFNLLFQPPQIVFQPAWDKDDKTLKWLAEQMLGGVPDRVRLGDQLHKRIWGNRRGR